MSKIIVYDFEVFKYDTLFGAIILDDNSEMLYQTWDLEEIKEFYYNNSNCLWIGHNNWYYDDHILEAIVKNKNPYEVSKKILSSDFRLKSKLHILSFDLMNSNKSLFSLKLTELICGRNIHTSDVDFELDRPLTEKEKMLTEKYNQDDLNQTNYNFNRFFGKLKLRLDIIKEFNLNLEHNLKVTGTQLAANVLKAKRRPELSSSEYKIEPKIYDNLILENQEIKDFYLNEKFREKGAKLLVNIGNAELTVAAGGIHSAVKKYHSKKCLYLDVSGYYNLIMLYHDLLPRTIDDESKKLYEYMYHEQLRLKKIDPIKRGVYKTILLSVFGAMNNEYTDFYDPWKALLVTTTGELFLCDLLEKIKDLVTIIQSNTDGIMVEPHDWKDEQKIIDIVDEWQARTGFVIKREYIYDLWQRDVNCYICKDENGNIINKGEAVKNYDLMGEAYSNGYIFECKEPSIIAIGIVNQLIFDKSAEETVEELKNDLKLFQYACKKNTYDYTTYDLLDIITNEKTSVKLQGIDRAFAYNDKNFIGMVYKHKDKNGKHMTAKVSNLPDSVFIYNDDVSIESNIKEIQNKIDYDYYVKRIYERIEEFIEI